MTGTNTLDRESRIDAPVAAIESVTLEVPDPAAAKAFYAAAFGDLAGVDVRAAESSSSGFAGFTMSLVVAQPSTVDSLVGTALDAGAKSLKPVAKTFWGYGGAVQAPDGAVWTIATSSKKDTAPATREIDDVVLLLGVADVRASKRFYADRGFAVKRSFGGKYVEFDTGSKVKLALNKRDALAKNAGVSPDGSGSHRVIIEGNTGSFVDPDGFEWRR